MFTNTVSRRMNNFFYRSINNNHVDFNATPVIICLHAISGNYARAIWESAVSDNAFNGRVPFISIMTRDDEQFKELFGNVRSFVIKIAFSLNEGTAQSVGFMRGIYLNGSVM